jgi:hypothetical protein
MEERLRFVACLLEGETMTDLCREFGISRKIGCKIFDRGKEHGLEALAGRSTSGPAQSPRGHPLRPGSVRHGCRPPSPASGQPPWEKLQHVRCRLMC